MKGGSIDPPDHDYAGRMVTNDPFKASMKGGSIDPPDATPCMPLRLPADLNELQ